MGIMDILRKSPPKAADLLFGGPEEREKARKASEEFGTFETLARDVAPYLPQYSDLRAFDPKKYQYFDKNPSDYFNMPMAETSKNRFFPMVMEYTPKDREQDRSFTRLPPGGIAVYGPENATGRVLAHEIRHLRNLDQYKDQDSELVNRIKDLLSSKNQEEFDDNVSMLEDIQFGEFQEAGDVKDALKEYLGDPEFMDPLKTKTSSFVEKLFDITKSSLDEGIGALDMQPKKKVTDPDKSRAKAAVAGIVRKAGLQQLPDSEKLEDVEDDVMQQLNRVLGRK